MNFLLATLMRGAKQARGKRRIELGKLSKSNMPFKVYSRISPDTIFNKFLLGFQDISGYIKNHFS